LICSCTRSITGAAADDPHEGLLLPDTLGQFLDLALLDHERGHVGHRFDAPDHLAALVAQDRGILEQVDFPTALRSDAAVLADGLAVFKEGAPDCRAVPIAVDTGVRVEDRTGLADHLLEPISGDFLGGRVKRNDGAIAIDDHQTVAHRVEDGLEEFRVVDQFVNFHNGNLHR
jgi:hypothetical protein